VLLWRQPAIDEAAHAGVTTSPGGAFSDGRRTPTAKVVEELGHYDPTKNPPFLKLDREKAAHIITNGIVSEVK
jgi:hypothetical protein